MHSVDVNFAKTVFFNFFFLHKAVVNTITNFCPQCVTIVRYEKLKVLSASEDTESYGYI